MADTNGAPSHSPESDDPGSERHEALSNLVDAGVCRLDASGALVAVDGSLVALLDRPHDDLLGEHCSALVVDAHRPRVEAALDRCDGGGGPTAVDVRCTARGGETVRCELRVDAFEGGGDERYVAVVRERSPERDRQPERAHRREEEAKQRAENTGQEAEDVERRAEDEKRWTKDAGRQTDDEKRRSGATERLAPGVFDRVLETGTIAVGLVEGASTVTGAEGRVEDVFALAGAGAGDGDGSADGSRVYDRDGEPVPPDERPHARATETGEPVADRTYRVEGADGESRWLSVTAVPAGGERALVISHDVSDLAEQTRQLERQAEAQREQLTALSDLNRLVGEVTTRLVEQSTREEIEETVCEQLARADHVEFAWIAGGDVHAGDAEVRAASGAEASLDDVNVDLAGETASGPIGRALRTREVQVIRDGPDDPDCEHDPDCEPWREAARRHGFRAAVFVPITHEDALYGALNVYASRTDSFDGEKRDLVARLGDVVGHAIAAVERKRALTTDEVTELEFRIPDVLDRRGLPDGDGTIRIDHAVPAGDGTYIKYGTASADMVETVEAFDEAFPHWEGVKLLGDSFDGVRFEGRLSEPPLRTAIASQGNRIAESVVEDGDHRLVVHNPQGGEVRPVVEAVREAYPSAEFLSQRQVTRRDEPTRCLRQELLDGLTPRQRTVVESAFFAGFFEWPRESTGEDVAASLDIAPSTFHQHLRKAEQSILQMLLSEPSVEE